MTEQSNKTPTRRFMIASWALTGLIVALAVAFAAWRLTSSAQAAPPASTPTIAAAGGPSGRAPAGLPDPAAAGATDSIRRVLTLKTNIPAERPRYDAVEYTVEEGDALFSIAASFKVKPETVLWANYDALNDDPHSLRPGQKLIIPPIDGVYYQWKEGDTIESVAEEMEAKPQDILSWVGNKLDLADPQISVGQSIMVPGGHREFKQWIIADPGRGNSSGGVGSNSCGGGAFGTGGFIWPSNNHFLSGNDYSSYHHGIDIAGNTGDAVYASDSGVVTLVAAGWNYGYGNIIVVNHGNGYSTLYAHLSGLNASHCQSVSQGQVIGAIGSTGNSSGSHLHFEVRLNGGFVNPWQVLP
jgi:murein DD-endopeptidase MepM/ murein hydrolase activator NlpD